MRLATIARANGDESVAAIRHAEGFVGVDRLNAQTGSTWSTALLDLLQRDEMPALAAVAKSMPPGLVEPEAGVRVVAPWTRPGKVIGIGLNYADHARDLDVALPDEPATFLRPSTAITGAGDAIRLPRQSERVTAEAELGLVIGRRCRDVTPEQARDFVFGFVSIIDVTAEDILRRNPRFLTRSKSFDSFFQWGPVVITSDEVDDVEQLRVRTVVNDEVAAENVVSNMKFGPYELVSFFSKEMTLEPGDVFSTGTPGAAVLAAGDVVRCEISGFPTLEAPVVDA